MTTCAPDRYDVREITDAAQWNGVVQGFAGADLRQGFEWGELRADHGWQPTRLAAFLPGGECAAACSLLWRGLPGLGSVMYAPRGPLSGGDAGALGALIDSVRAVARRQAAVVFRVSPGRESAGLAPTLARAGFTALEEQSTTWNTPRPAQTLDLSPPEADLLRRLRKRFREHIAAGPRKGVLVEESESDADLLQFHALLVQTGRMKRIPVRDLSFYRSLFRHYRGRGLMLLVARAQGRLVGGILGLRFGRRVSMLYTSIRSGMPDGLRHGVAPVMFWEFIRRAKQAGCELIDLGSSGVQIPPSESDSGYGVYRFKAGLGAVMHDSPRYHDLVFRPLAYRALRVCESRMLPQMWRLAAHATTMSALRRAAA